MKELSQVASLPRPGVPTSPVPEPPTRPDIGQPRRPEPERPSDPDIGRPARPKPEPPTEAPDESVHTNL